MVPRMLLEPLRYLLIELGRWDRAACELESHGVAATVPSAARASMRRELEALHHGLRVAAPGGSLVDRLNERLHGLFAPSERGTARARFARRERALLRHYEALCERALPFSISTILLRHYATLKRASENAWAGPVVWRPQRHAVAASRTA